MDGQVLLKKALSAGAFLIAISAGLAATETSANAQLSPANRCQIARAKAAAKQFSAVINCNVKEVRAEAAGRLFDISGCIADAHQKLIDTFARIDLRFPTCPT